MEARITKRQEVEAKEERQRMASQNRAKEEEKRFKEMKNFTFDYEGGLINLGVGEAPRPFARQSTQQQ